MRLELSRAGGKRSGRAGRTQNSNFYTFSEKSYIIVWTLIELWKYVIPHGKIKVKGCLKVGNNLLEHFTIPLSYRLVPGILLKRSLVLSDDSNMAEDIQPISLDVQYLSSQGVSYLVSQRTILRILTIS